MNQHLKFGIGIGATILAGVATMNSRSIGESIATNLRLAPAQAQAQTLKIVFPTRSGTTDLEAKAKAVTAFLSKELQQPVEAVIADETAAVEALRANRADVAFLSSRSALKARELANASLYLAEVRSNYSGGHTYKSIFVVSKNSPLKSGQGEATLSQLKGKRISFTSPTSGSGFIFPVAELVQQKLIPNRDRLNGFFGQVTYGGSYDKALQAVLRNQADVAAVSEYTLGAPYITAAEASNLRVLYSISGVPAHGIVIDDDVSVSDRNKLIAAMMKLNEPANNRLFTALYNSTKLVKVNNSHLKPTQVALEQAGMKP
ncbi:phosphate/phosphite/phosphonate ABC transporter substrate-binding protein [Chamaesiphon minutus]|uniref:Phosphate/phosphite/phosphonate ABC transporter, periplasmic binding protein n=1 Tax=Chamaesiphon minutus (strain ATCC 27169 / PCC 6605) TaxID=1173020 RepID=K9UPG7_CHAP6|nr:phosphate/phosphite/phosphonate ABC transporter substrate-binding protein [Chamaesiphon minutus]AFY96099.1 phosphate/phosphite/phosphonate ABC transporter, periplasmic binding protein [Chamaesiphon minutus PCC 6605]